MTTREFNVKVIVKEYENDFYNFGLQGWHFELFVGNYDSCMTQLEKLVDSVSNSVFIDPITGDPFRYSLVPQIEYQ